MVCLRFPRRDPGRNELWISYVERLGVPRGLVRASSRLCFRHFGDDDYTVIANRRRRLRPRAVPSIGIVSLHINVR